MSAGTEKTKMSSVVTSRELIKRCGGDPDKPLGRIEFPYEDRQFPELPEPLAPQGMEATRDTICAHGIRWPWACDDCDRALDAPQPVPSGVAQQENRRVILESPFAGDVAANIAYARAAMADCLTRGEAPFASHLLYTQDGVLDDANPAQREHGIMAGLAWGCVAEATVVYTDRGISKGMRLGIDRATAEGRPVEYRTLTYTREPKEGGSDGN